MCRGVVVSDLIVCCLCYHISVFVVGPKEHIWVLYNGNRDLQNVICFSLCGNASYFVNLPGFVVSVDKFGTLTLVGWPYGGMDNTRLDSLFRIHASHKKLVVLLSWIIHSSSRFNISYPSTSLDHIHYALKPLVAWRKFLSRKYMPRATRTHKFCGFDIILADILARRVMLNLCCSLTPTLPSLLAA